MPQEPIRLNKFIATRLGIGRRAADDAVSAGQVRINGEKPQLGARVFPGDEVDVQGTRLTFSDAPEFTYVLLDKPKGYVCSRRQQGDTPTIYSLLPTELQQLKPVGRLDKDSSGLLLLTNDGDLAHQLTHPSFHKIKIYEVALDHPLEPLHRQMITEHGINLPDGVSKFVVERINEDDNTRWRITMHEGRNRQIRRTFAALGYNVLGLHRTNFGSMSLAQLGGNKFAIIPRP